MSSKKNINPFLDSQIHRDNMHKKHAKALLQNHKQEKTENSSMYFT